MPFPGGDHCTEPPLIGSWPLSIHVGALMRLRFTFATLLASVVTTSADAGSTVPGSPFNGSNGTLDSNSGPANADTPSGKNDNAFGQGTKEDQTSVNVVTGSIPPNKNDLTNLYANGGNGTTPATASHVFLYLG